MYRKGLAVEPHIGQVSLNNLAAVLVELRAVIDSRRGLVGLLRLGCGGRLSSLASAAAGGQRKQQNGQQPRRHAHGKRKMLHHRFSYQISKIGQPKVG